MDVKNYKWRLNKVWHKMLYGCTHMATVGVKGLMLKLLDPCCWWCCHWCSWYNLQHIARHTAVAASNGTEPNRTENFREKRPQATLTRLPNLVQKSSRNWPRMPTIHEKHALLNVAATSYVSKIKTGFIVKGMNLSKSKVRKTCENVFVHWCFFHYFNSVETYGQSLAAAWPRLRCDTLTQVGQCHLPGKTSCDVTWWAIMWCTLIETRPPFFDRYVVVFLINNL